MLRLLLLVLVGLAGCAPAVDLRVPAYAGPPIAGRLLVVHAGPVVPTAGALEASGLTDVGAFETATWEALHSALGEAYRFTDVQGGTLPDSMRLQPVFASQQVVAGDRPGDRWERRTVYLPSAPFHDVSAEFVLVVDTVYADRRLGSVAARPSAGQVAASVALGVAFGIIAVPTGRIVRGSAVRARFSLYRPGSSVPLMVGELGGFGAGAEGAAPEGAWASSIRAVAESLGRNGRIEPR